MPAGHRGPGLRKALKHHPALSLFQEAGAERIPRDFLLCPVVFFCPNISNGPGYDFFLYVFSLILTVEVKKKVSSFLACFCTSD
jgi:hypothetical protein